MNDPRSWLCGELPKLEDAGLITSEQAGKIRAYYDAQPAKDKPLNLAVVLFGVIGSLLIGGGLILIVAHNWSELTRPARTVAAVVPLIVAQSLAVWTLLRRNDSAAWRESVAIGWTLTVALAIALIAQTYHMPGAFDTFTLTWMLLTLPVVYLMRSVSVLMIYLAGILAWGFSAQYLRGHNLEFWLLLAAILPLVWRWHKKLPFGARAVLSRWALIATLTTALMGYVDYYSEVTWLITNSLFAAALFAYGVLAEKDAPSSWQKPALVLGTVGLAVLAYMLTWHWFWEEMDHGFQIRPGLDQPWLYICTLASVVVFYAMTFGRLVTLRYPVAIMWAAIPLFYIVGLLAPGSEGVIVLLIIAANIYVLGAGALTLWSGVRMESLTRVNVGMIVVASLIVSRFFDEEFSILIRALVFIALGIAFLLVNMRLARKKAGRGAT